VLEGTWADGQGLGDVVSAGLITGRRDAVALLGTIWGEFTPLFRGHKSMPMVVC
jgi:hypothetical protein